MQAIKPWYQSKTVWVNALILLLALADAARALPLPPEWSPYLVAIIPVLNVLLRLTTSSGIAGFAPPQGEAMRAVPAPQDAPPEDAGAPSLAGQIAADNGIALPKDEA